MVTKGWLSVSMGVILLSASMVSILVSRSMNSRLSAFSASMSLPSRSDVMFTWKKKKKHQIRFLALGIRAEEVINGLSRLKRRYRKIPAKVFSHPEAC